MAKFFEVFCIVSCLICMQECIVSDCLHVAVSAVSVDSAESFFCDVLGLKKLKEFVVSEKLCFDIFGRKEEVNVVVFGCGSVQFEVFISKCGSSSCFSHVCLSVSDVCLLESRCKKFGFEFKRVLKKDKEIFFASDGSNNLYEIKQV